jgi:hypothetical protein
MITIFYVFDVFVSAWLINISNHAISYILYNNRPQFLIILKPFDWVLLLYNFLWVYSNPEQSSP